MQILVINMVRFGKWAHTPTQRFWKFPPGRYCYYKKGNFAKLPIAYCLANVKK